MTARPQEYASDPKLNVWDQWCVMSDRPYNKDGELALLNEAACRQIVANFAASRDDLPCNISHDKQQVVAHYNALALFIGGKCVAHADHAGMPAPTVLDLPGGDDGSPPDDGIYWRRARITDLGRGAKQFLRKCSPEFLTAAKNPHGDSIGPQALGGAWTNYPFLDGCELHEFERPKEPVKMAKKTYARKCMEDAGVDEKDDAAQKMSKLRAYWRGAHGAKYAKFESAAGVDEKDDDDKKYTKIMAYMSGKFEDHAEPDGDEPTPGGKPAQMTEGPVVSPGAPTVITDKPGESKDQVPGPGGSMVGAGAEVRMTRAEFQRYEASAAQLPAIQQQLQQTSAQVQQLTREREAAKTAAAATEFTRAAYLAGRVPMFPNDSPEAAQARIVQQYTAFGKEAAERMLAAPNSFPVRANTEMPLQFSSDTPAGGARGGVMKDGESPSDAILRLAREKQKAAGDKDDAKLLEFSREVCAEHPKLAELYSNQGRLALFDGLPGFSGVRA